jgi:hypothetical protein
LLEHLSYCKAPGTNGETEFHNIVREMYPDANGTAVPNSWTASQVQNYVIKGKVPTWMDKSNADAIVVVWIQNETDKSIAQAAKSTRVSIPLDVSLTGCKPMQFACTAGPTASINSTTTITNPGTTTLTSATIYYKLDAGAYTSMPWTGSLAPGASATVTIPAISAGTGTHTITDSVSMPNTTVDKNPANNTRTLEVIVRNTTGVPLPIATGFENAGSLPTDWIILDADNNGNKPVMGYSSTSNIGHGASKYTLWFRFPYEPNPETNYVIMPQGTLPAGPKALDFWVAHALRTGANVDKLEIVYSTNCGSTWTTVWTKTGTQLASAPPTANADAYVPAQADWKKWSVDMTAVPVGAMIAFRGVGATGQNLFVDDVNLRTGPTGVENIIATNTVSIYPNPAKESATLEFTLNKGGKVTVNVLDAVGRVISTVSNTTMQQGAQHVSIPTSTLAAGVYNISIQTEEGALTQRLSVVK